MFRWLFSKTYREACALRNHVQRLVNAQRDLMAPAALQFVGAALLALQKDMNDGVNAKELRQQMAAMEKVATKWLRPYPHPAWRENVEVLLVALAVAMGIRTFFLQPFKIPTGSMQPTLFGVTATNLMAKKDFHIPTGWERMKRWFEGYSYIHVVAHNEGTIDGVSPTRRFLIFNIKQSLSIGGVAQTIWFPPDMGEAMSDGLGNVIDPLVYRAGLMPGHVYHKGEDVVKLEVHAGDHLFVDRLTYNFRKPQRGEIIVFETEGIPEEMRDRYRIPPDQFYIKRLVALSGEHVQIGDDRHLIINGRRLDASTPHFESVYGFDPKNPPRESEYSGHVNGTVSQEYNLNLGVPPLFPNEKTVYDVPAGDCMPMGDNTCNSSDSRFWGAIPENFVIGKSFFVYWPLTKRFGVGQSVTAQ